MNILNKLTINYLKSNRRRTIVTIIGIIISVAMITSVNIFGESAMKMVSDAVKIEKGMWEAGVHDISVENLQKLKDEKNYSNISEMNIYGLSKEISTNTDGNVTEREYIHVSINEKDLKNLFSMNIIGDLPKNDNEIILALPNVLVNKNEYIDKEKEFNVQEIVNVQNETDKKAIKEIINKKYKIVGITRGGIINNNVVIHVNRENNIYNNKLGIKSVGLIGNIKYKSKMRQELKNLIPPKIKTDEELKNTLNKALYSENLIFNDYALMLYEKDTPVKEIKNIMNVFKTVLFVVIGVSTLLVIYNSFSIAISERKKEYGMLLSIGASKKQIKKMVRLEALYMSLIGITLGLIVGYLGTYITMIVLNQYIMQILKFAIKVNNLNLNKTLLDSYKLQPIINLQIVSLSILVSAIIIYISIIIPALKAARTSPISSIKNIDDIKDKRKKQRTSILTKKIFGIEGDIASKYLRRSKGKYRITIISLVVSIVLYLITSNLFTATSAITNVLDKNNIDNADIVQIVPGFGDTTYYDKIQTLMKKYDDKKILTGYSYGAYLTTNLEELNINSKNKNKLKKYILSFKETEEEKWFEEEFRKYKIDVVAIYGGKEKEYLKLLGVNELEDNKAIVMSNIMNATKKKIVNIPLINKNTNKIGIYSNFYNEAEKNNKNQKIIELDVQKVSDSKNMPFVNREGKITIFINKNTFNTIGAKINSLNNVNQKLNDNKIGIQMITLYNFNLQNGTSEIEDDMNYMLKQDKYFGFAVNMKELEKVNLAFITIVNILLYGFLTLIILIAISNVFNTISTNILLRQRDFANLKSFGMTQKQMKKMLDYESIFYILKSAFFGILISYGIMYFTYYNLKNSLDIQNFISWQSMLSVIVFLYIVMRITMKYARTKIDKENLIDVIKKETI